jgi:ribonuclease BN (tRNA processing enzyme)
MVDAGTIGAALSLSEQKQIRVILLSHLHFDHVKGLPTLADNLIDDVRDPVVIAGIPEVLNGLQTHIFNDAVYPNFLKLPAPQRPVFTCRPLQARRVNEAAGLQITAIPVNHTVPAVGFVIGDGTSSILYSGDTHETVEIWSVAGQDPVLKAAFIESSFPDEMGDTAFASRHLTPSLLAREFRKIGRPDLPVFVYHLKPRVREVIRRQLSRLGIPNLTVLEEEQEILV